MHSARAAEFPHNHYNHEERLMNAKMNPSAVPIRGSNMPIPDTKSVDAAKGAHDAALAALNAAKGAHDAAKRAHDAAQGVLNAAKGAHDAAQGVLAAAKGAHDAAKGAHDAAKRAHEAAKPRAKGAHD
jgi:hypothetical protein